MQICTALNHEASLKSSDTARV